MLFHEIAVILSRTKKGTTMALAIKAIPTLYGDEARRFRDMADDAERDYDLRPKRNIKEDPRYLAMLKILAQSNINY